MIKIPKNIDLNKYENVVKKLLQLNCMCNAGGEAICGEICMQILECNIMNEKYKPHEYIANRFLNYIFEKHECHKNEYMYTMIDNVCTIIFDNYHPNNMIGCSVRKMCHVMLEGSIQNRYIGTIKKLIEKYNIINIHDIFSKINNFDSQNAIELIDMLFQKYVNTYIINITDLFIYNHDHIIKKICEFINNLEQEYIDKNIIYSNNYLHIACKYLPHTVPICEILTSRGYKYDNDCLIYACENNNSNSLCYILSASRIPVNNDHYRAIIRSKNIAIKKKPELYSVKLYYRSLYEEVTDTGLKNQNNKILEEMIVNKINILCDYGYKLTDVDVVQSIENLIDITPITKRFDMVFGDAVFTVCHIHSFYPQFNFKNIPCEKIVLYNMCKNDKWIDVKKYIKIYDIIPDEICMSIAKRRRSNRTFINGLINAGYKKTS